MRILHAMGSMESGGAEVWLMHLLRQVDPTEFHMDILVHTTEHCAYDDEIRDLGSRVIPCMGGKNPLLYARNFNKIMAEHGPYDVMDSHVHYYSGFVLWLAHRAGVPTLIAHSHVDTRDPEERAGIARAAYLALMRRMISRYADHGLAVSKKAAEDLFGLDWAEDPRWRLLYCGIDLEPFRQPVDTRQARREFGIAERSYVVGHVGRFSEQKNHEYLIEIIAEVAKVAPDVRFLLVGDGPLRPLIERKVNIMGLNDQVVFTGARDDVPRLMTGVMDAFVLPSLYEGLPLVLMEAEAAGLQCLFSDVITEEADIVDSLVKRLPLDVPASTWATAIIDLYRKGLATRDPKAISIVEDSVFNIRHCIEELLGVYEGRD